MGNVPSDALKLSVSDPSDNEYGISFDSESFAEGEHRQCYIGTLSNDKAPKHCKKVVLKVFKSHYVDADYQCVKDLERSIICHEYGTKFNKAIKETIACSDSMRISFPAPLRLNIKRSKLLETNQDNALRQKLEAAAFNNIPIRLHEHNKYLTLEPFLKNNDLYKFDKLSSNNGWFDTASNFYQILSAFSHFSWAKSKGRLLINGFEGIVRGDALCLSVGHVHSDKFGKLGQTDLGIIGMINFFLHHECNEYCKHLPSLNTTLLINHLSTDSILEPMQATTYLFELNQQTMQMDEESLKIAYAASVKETFEKKRAAKQQREGVRADTKEQAKVIVAAETMPIEQIAVDAVVEEEVEEVQEEAVECDEEILDESVQQNNYWFAEEIVSGSEFVYGQGSNSKNQNGDLLNFINVDAEHFGQEENEQNEWELL